MDLTARPALLVMAIAVVASLLAEIRIGTLREVGGIGGRFAATWLVCRLVGQVLKAKIRSYAKPE